MIFSCVSQNLFNCILYFLLIYVLADGVQTTHKLAHHHQQKTMPTSAVAATGEDVPQWQRIEDREMTKSRFVDVNVVERRIDAEKTPIFGGQNFLLTAS